MEGRSLKDSFEARYGLAKVLRSVNAPQTRKKSAKGFEKLEYSCKDLQAILNFSNQSHWLFCRCRYGIF